LGEGEALLAGVAELDGLAEAEAEAEALGAAAMVTAVEASGTEPREGVALATAVRATDVPTPVPDGTVICVCMSADAGVTLVPRSPTAQEVFPLPPGQSLVKVGD
jgi:hypothetical protein